MADIKVLKVNAGGFREEHAEASDSIKLLSLKTANYELTDTKLGKLVDGADAANEHLHDGRYFRENEHLNISAGAADAGKPIVLDAGGKIDGSMIDSGDVAHDSTSGVAASTAHTAFPLLTGTRDFTGIQSYNNHKNFTVATQIPDKQYVDEAIAAAIMGDEWHDSVIDRLATPPGSPNDGDRYLVIATASGAWTGKENQIAEYDGVGLAWVFTVPTTGSHVSVDDETDGLYYFGGSSWTKKYFESTTASLGCQKVGMDIRADLLANGGLDLSTNSLFVVTDNATIEKNPTGGALRVKADGINDTHIDWGTGTNQVSAVDMPIADAGNYFPTDNVEAALQSLAAWIAQAGVDFTVGTGGVTKGDPVYISAANTVSKWSTITSGDWVVGIAATTEAAAGTVRVLANDTVITGILTTATPGLPVYWTGSAFTQSIPTGGGAYVWKLGLAKNATDLVVEVELIKKNA